MRDLRKIIGELRNAQGKVDFQSLDRKALSVGVQVSKQALREEPSIALTPWSANALHALDDKERLEVSDPESKMEAYYTKQTLRLLKKYCPNSSTNYNLKGSPLDFNNYEVDCWRNFKRGKDVRHVVPGMSKKREENFSKFYKPVGSNLKVDWSSDTFKKAIDLLDMSLPEVASLKDWQQVSLPYQSKHTNVGYPFYRPDNAVDKATGKTYARLTSDIAKGKRPQEVVNYPYIAFGRNLRGKARQILGGSRIQALVFNQLEAAEIEAYKRKSPLFIGYNDETIQREKLVKLADFLQLYPDMTAMNRDYSNFDTTVSPVLRSLIDAVSIIKASDARGKEIAFWRGVAHYKSLLVNGYTGRLHPIYARIFSGEIDTNRGGGLVNAFADIYTMLQLWPGFYRVYEILMKQGTSALWVMGDDNLMIQPKRISNTEYSKRLKHTFSLDVSHDKGEYGLFFLQRRLFLRNNKYVYITPFTRVIRSLISKESSKGLGPAGWVLAAWTLLWQLREWPELLRDVADIFAKYDKYSLGRNWTVRELRSRLAQEDSEAVSKGNLDTVSKLYDGDPNKQSIYTDSKVSDDFLHQMKKLLG